MQTKNVAVVTGGAQGLGRAICLLLAARGWSLAIVDINGAAARTAAEDCRQAGAAAVLPLEIDLTTPDGPGRMIAEAHATFGRLDALVNNAGYGAGETFLEIDPKIWDRTFDLNVRATIFATTAAGRIMTAQRSGRIVNITSPASRMALPSYTAYSASKAAVDSITRAAAVALAPHGVRVNSVAPGMMDTPLQQVTERRFAEIEGRNDIEAFLAERTRRIPIGHRVDCEEVASAVVWLVADAPDYITAERLNVSGGLDKD
jgi:NAD(P)-dependent dehydrogenase (short-subunit alcohol dehydrogenase family)